MSTQEVDRTMIGLIMAMERRPKKKNNEKSLRFSRSSDSRRRRKDWDNNLVWKRKRQLRCKGERA